MINSNLNVELLRALVENRNRTDSIHNTEDPAFDQLFLSLLGEQAEDQGIYPNESATAFLLGRMNGSHYSPNVSPIAVSTSTQYPPSLEKSDVDPIIVEKAQKYGLDPNLVRDVIKQESGFQTDVVSHAGAIGLMQLMPRTAAGLGVNPHDPVDNVEGGTRFLKNLILKYDGNVDVALAAYNGGPGRVDRLGIQTSADLVEKMHLLPQETQAYVGKVLGHYARYSS